MAEPTVKRRGFLLVLSSPSGAGKTTITRTLVAQDRALKLSVSVTTRPQRPGEIEGKHYYFTTKEKFDAMIATGELLEYASVFGNWYGTPRAPVTKALEAGTDIIGDVDWQGTQQLKQTFREDLVAVFILPPTMAELKRRLEMRAQDTHEVVQARMAESSEELSHWAEYDYVIVNEDIEQAVHEVRMILEVERKRRSRQPWLADFVNRLRSGA
jgi:guanylate kinase